jgi:S-DNA-T family DNA segregation ATPase FtsK/SpoIIIE
MNFRSVFLGIAFIMFGATLGLALLSYSAQDPSLSTATSIAASNILGTFGSYSADLFLHIFGYASLLFVILPITWGSQIILKNEISYFWLRAIAALCNVVMLASLAMRYTKSVPFTYTGGAMGNLFNIYLSSINFDHFFLVQCMVCCALLYFSFNISWNVTAAILTSMLVYALRFVKYITHSCGKLFKLIVVHYKAISSREVDIEEYMEEPEPKPEPEPEARQAAPTSKPTAKVALNITNSMNLPQIDLLSCLKKQKITISEKFMQARAAELLQILKDFGINGTITGYSPGPVVTLYEFEPAAGIKSSRIISLSDDIARIMKATSTRISIIPGKNSLGIEIPNEDREIVYLRENMESKEYKNGIHKLPLILGKDISGETVIADLANMPHLLVAGTTGSGKSVAINTMILSLLFRYTPEECKFVMVDPKMLELSVYDGIPHLLAPVVTEASKAVVALKWTVKEMENRYRLMSHLNVRNIAGYNQAVENAIKNNTNLTKKVQTGFNIETGKPIYETLEIENKKLPFIVVIVDEMADLMIVAGKDIESLVQRLAQMARAAGIHIIMATQRPSVDVITGVIKANFPTRVSFQVTSKIDSRTILGEMGAEQLLGKGDMLYMSGGNKIKRVHGPFVSDGDVEKVVSFLKTQGSPNYSVDITSDIQSHMSLNTGTERDELYDQAVALVLRENKASTSFIQRCFKIGYNRAATIIEQMEKSRVIGSPNHVGKREILVEE